MNTNISIASVNLVMTGPKAIEVKRKNTPLAPFNLVANSHGSYKNKIYR